MLNTHTRRQYKTGIYDVSFEYISFEMNTFFRQIHTNI